MQNPLIIALAAIVVSTLVIAYIRRVVKDRCVKSFQNDLVTMLLNDKREIAGHLVVESTGIEVLYALREPSDTDANPIASGFSHASHILFKTEFGTLTALIRKHHSLSEKAKLSREREIKRAYQPNIFRKFGRKTANFFRMLKDALLEIFSVLSGAFETANPTSVMTTQKAQRAKIEREVVAQVSNSYDALLEKYIGNYVLCEFNMNGERIHLRGILKDYTAAFIEILNVHIPSIADEQAVQADVVLPRNLAVIRHLSENTRALRALDEEYNVRRFKRSMKKINVRKKESSGSS